jgi:hypothetical protein
LQHVGRNCCNFFSDVLFQIHRCPWFIFVHLALEISSEEEVLRLGTLVPMNIEVSTKYPLSKDRIVVFKYVSIAKAQCSADQRTMANQMLRVSLKLHSRTNSPRQRFHSQLSAISAGPCIRTFFRHFFPLKCAVCHQHKRLTCKDSRILLQKLTAAQLAEISQPFL